MSAVHRASADFRKFAISLPPGGSQYKVKIDGEVVDVTDYQAVATAMARSLRSAELQRFGRSPPGFDPLGLRSGKQQ
jgi:hypothetical protein